jgi:hypothetical protein
MLTNIDNNIKKYFQKNILMSFKHKQFKEGKLINFKLSGCYLSFVMLTEKKKETFEIPLPFNIKNDKDKLIFDYTLEALAEQDFELLVHLKSIHQIKKCKFYNNVLTITSLN